MRVRGGGMIGIKSAQNPASRSSDFFLDHKACLIFSSI